MVNYGQAFKLPFTDLRRSGALLLIALVVSVKGLIDKDTFEFLGISLESAPVLPVLLGFGIALLVILFFSIIFSGYLVRITSSAAHGRNLMPSFDGFGSLMLQGLKYFAGMLVYGLPFAVMFVIWVVLILSGDALGGVLLLLPVLLLWIFFFAYIIPMMTAHFSYEGRFAAFFELRKIFKYAFTTAYFVPWLVALAYSIGITIPSLIAGVLVGLLSLANPVLLLLVLPLDALTTVVLIPAVMNLYGQAYHEVRAASSLAATAKTKGHVKGKK